MRSNDAFRGMPHDIFAFTMLQELVARKLGLSLGEYGHFVASLHIYLEDLDKVENFQREGWQEKVYMPPMPKGDPTADVIRLLTHEREIRQGNARISDMHKESYWKDLSFLLEAFNYIKRKEYGELKRVAQFIDNIELRSYVIRKQK